MVLTCILNVCHFRYTETVKSVFSNRLKNWGFYVVKSVCITAEGLVPKGIESPSLALSYQDINNMRLVCSLNNDPAYGVQYLVTWFQDDVNVTSVLLRDTESASVYSVTQESFSNQQAVSFVLFLVSLGLLAFAFLSFFVSLFLSVCFLLRLEMIGCSVKGKTCVI